MASLRRSSYLPFASGTGPAAKGVVLDLVGPEQRAEALGGIDLIEKFGMSLWPSKGVELKAGTYE